MLREQTEHQGLPLWESCGIAWDTLEEISERLLLSEECVLDLACLFFSYFIPMAEGYVGNYLSELEKAWWENRKQRIIVK